MAGSLLILLGSLGAGWLVTTSVLTRWEPVIWLRTEPPGVVLSVTALTLGCWMTFRAWLRLGKTMHDDDVAADARLRIASTAALLWSAPQLLAAPIFSRDVFAYLNQGRLVLAGEDPYTTGVSSLENWFQLGTDQMWAEDATPYGPLFLWLSAGIMRITGTSADAAILLFRLACFAGVLLILIYLPKLARHLGTDPARAQWVTTANPLLIISFVSSAHNDALMIGFALAATWLAIRAAGTTGSRHWILGTAAVLLMVFSIGTKLITLVLLPFIGLLWAGAHASWRRRFGYWFVTAGLAGALLLGIGTIGGYGFGWVGVLAGAGSGVTFWAPLAVVGGVIAGPLLLLGLPHEWPLELIGTLGRAASIVIVIVLMFRGPSTKVFQRMMWAMAAVVLLSPLIQPWYLLWILPLFAAAGFLTETRTRHNTRRRWPLALTVAVTAFFLAYGAADQLFVHQFLELHTEMVMLSAGLSAASITLIAVLDTAARSVVLDREPSA